MGEEEVEDRVSGGEEILVGGGEVDVGEEEGEEVEVWGQGEFLQPHDGNY